MKLLSPERAIDRPVASTVQRRWRWAALAGLIVFLALAGYAVAVVGAGKASSTLPVSVLVAASDIHAGDTISAGALRATGISPQDPGLLLTLVEAQDRSRLIGHVASISVPAGQLLPANIVGAPGSNTLWTADVPIKHACRACGWGSRGVADRSAKQGRTAVGLRVHARRRGRPRRQQSGRPVAPGESGAPS